jgi:hypothetical protein
MNFATLRQIQRVTAHAAPICAFTLGVIAAWRSNYATNILASEALVFCVGCYLAFALYQRSLGRAAHVGLVMIEATSEESETDLVGLSDLPDIALTCSAVASVLAAALIIWVRPL